MSESKDSEKPVGGWNFPHYLRIRFSDSQRYVIIWAIAGVSCGLVAVGFHLSIDLLFKAVKGISRSMGGEGSIGFYIFLGSAPVIGGLLTGWILTYVEPGAAGSGIPQTKARYYRDFGVFRLREAFFRFIAGTLSVGFGMSLGREGPTVHICSAVSSKIGQFFGMGKKRIQAMVPLGMGAGISAAFNTPMAAVFFVFEELLGDFSSKSFFGIFLAVVLAAVVQRLIIGEHPAFDIEIGLISTDFWMLLSLPLGLLCALFGRLYVEAILRTRLYFRDRVRIPKWIRPGIGGLGVGLIGVCVMLLSDGNSGIFGIGYGDLDAALNGRLTVISVVLLLFVGKMAATVIGYGSGGSGGLFAPTLFIGGMLGALVGLIGQSVFNFDSEIVGAISLLGMGAFFAAVIRCPMTSIVMIWEMTGLYSLILPLMAGNILAYLLSMKMQPVPLYDSLLLQDKINLKKMPHYKGDQDWRNLPISTIMTFDPISVKADWSVEEALERIHHEHWEHHAYPVLNDEDELVSMITHHELEETFKENGATPVKGIMGQHELVVILPEQSIRDVAQVLVIEDVLQAPVVSAKDKKKMVGLVTLHDIARQQNAIDDSIGRH